MKTHITSTMAPLHIAILHTAEPERIRATLEGLRGQAGYPHRISVVDTSGDSASHLYLNTLYDAGLIDNLVIAVSPVAPMVPLMQALSAVNAPYSLVLASGPSFGQPGWLARMLEALITSGVPALVGTADGTGETTLSPVFDPHQLSERMCRSGQLVLATHAALDCINSYARRSTEPRQASGPHSADIAARESLRQAVQNLR